MDIHFIILWIKHQNWFVLSFAINGVLNMVVAGCKVMGWNRLAKFCGKLEDALTAMVQAWINRKQGASNVVNNSIVSDTTSSGTKL